MTSYIYIFTILICVLGSCVPRAHKSIELSSEEISSLISAIGPLSSREANLHVMYTEVYNDSTLEVEVWQNSMEPDGNFITEKLQVDGSRVFVYKKDITLHLLKNKDILDKLPIFRMDSPMWKVLVKRRAGEISFYQIDYFKVLKNSGIDDGSYY